MGRRRLTADTHRPVAPRQGRPAVDGFAERIDDAAKPLRMRPHHRFGLDQFRLASQPHAFQRAIWHGKGQTIPETDDFAAHTPAAPRDQVAPVTDRQVSGNAADLQQHPLNAHDLAVNLGGGNAGYLRLSVLKGRRHGQALISRNRKSKQFPGNSISENSTPSLCL